MRSRNPIDHAGRWLAVGGLVLVADVLLSLDLLVPDLTELVGIRLAPAFLLAGSAADSSWRPTSP